MQFFHKIKKFIELEALSGIILFSASGLAIAWANSSNSEIYFKIFQTEFLKMSLLHWVNDGLMAIFFLLVGLEIKRELSEGHLSSPRKAVLPIFAALGGMLIPAIFYSYYNWGLPSSAGWGIPMATDIAFVVGIMALFGKRIPLALKIFLLALAIVDDLGAVMVIAFFYTKRLDWILLLLVGAIVIFLSVQKNYARSSVWLYLFSGILMWLLILKSGIHATIAGILLAAVIPISVGNSIEHKIHPFVAFFIMPVFAFANAGVVFSFQNISLTAWKGVLIGLLVGKPLGILLFSWIAVQLKTAKLPEDVSWWHILGAGCLGGMGFTMSLFVTNLAFTDSAMINGAKLGILIASLLSALLGALVFSAIPKR